MILRVFPKATTATPRDDLVRIGYPTLFDPVPDISEVHVSVTFTWDKEEGERLQNNYQAVYPGIPIIIGGPAFDDPGGKFELGRYLSRGNVITSRGCPGKCSRCFVPKREGELRELEIKDGWKIHDNNLLACSEKHIEAVFEMLSRQPHRPLFVGGLEACRITPTIAKRLKEIGTARLYVAYDRPSQLADVNKAGGILESAGLKRGSHNYCYVLAAFEGDTLEKAESRCREVYAAGFFPYAMIYIPDSGIRPNSEWRRWHKTRVRPAIIRSDYRSLA